MVFMPIFARNAKIRARNADFNCYVNHFGAFSMIQAPGASNVKRASRLKNEFPAL